MLTIRQKHSFYFRRNSKQTYSNYKMPADSILVINNTFYLKKQMFGISVNMIIKMVKRLKSRCGC
jgi:hypothetical protein